MLDSNFCFKFEELTIFYNIEDRFQFLVIFVTKLWLRNAVYN